MTIREAARRLGISKSAVHRMVGSGAIGCLRIGRRVVISEGDLGAVLARAQDDTRRLQGLPETDWSRIREDFPGLFGNNALPRRTRRTGRTRSTATEVTA